MSPEGDFKPKVPETEEAAKRAAYANARKEFLAEEIKTWKMTGSETPLVDALMPDVFALFVDYAEAVIIYNGLPTSKKNRRARMAIAKAAKEQGLPEYVEQQLNEGRAQKLRVRWKKHVDQRYLNSHNAEMFTSWSAPPNVELGDSTHRKGLGYHQR